MVGIIRTRYQHQASDMQPRRIMNLLFRSELQHEPQGIPKKGDIGPPLAPTIPIAGNGKHELQRLLDSHRTRCIAATANGNNEGWALHMALWVSKGERGLNILISSRD